MRPWPCSTMLFKNWQQRILTAFAHRELNSFRIPICRKCRMGSLKAVERDASGLTVPLQCFTEESLSGGHVPGTAQVRFEGVAVFIHGAMEIHPLASHLD